MLTGSDDKTPAAGDGRDVLAAWRALAPLMDLVTPMALRGRPRRVIHDWYDDAASTILRMLVLAGGRREEPYPAARAGRTAAGSA